MVSLKLKLARLEQGSKTTDDMIEEAPGDGGEVIEIPIIQCPMCLNRTTQADIDMANAFYTTIMEFMKSYLMLLDYV